MAQIKDLVNNNQIFTEAKKKFNKEKRLLPKHYFIDETGKPEFFAKGGKLLVGKEGFSKILMIGMVEVDNRNLFKDKILKFQNEVKQSKKLSSLKYIQDEKWYFHASKDCPKVRSRFFNFLLSLEFNVYIVIGRKNLATFHDKHKGSTEFFYFDLVKHLTKHTFVSNNNHLHLADRSGSNMKLFRGSIQKAFDNYKSHKKGNVERLFNCDILKSSTSLELSVPDYMLWALQRYILHGDDTYYKIVQKKYTYIFDLVENKHFHKENPFCITKCKPF